MAQAWCTRGHHAHLVDADDFSMGAPLASARAQPVVLNEVQHRIDLAVHNFAGVDGLAMKHHDAASNVVRLLVDAGRGSPLSLELSVGDRDPHTLWPPPVFDLFPAIFSPSVGPRFSTRRGTQTSPGCVRAMRVGAPVGPEVDRGVESESRERKRTDSHAQAKKERKGKRVKPSTSTITSTVCVCVCVRARARARA